MNRHEQTIIAAESIIPRPADAAPVSGRSVSENSGAPRQRPGIMLLSELLRCPRHIGAICPSSRYLSRQMAAAVDVNAAGLIVELGGGTGAVTGSLLRHGVAADRLIVVEQSAQLAHYLARQFPRICVVHGDAADAQAIVSQHGAVGAIVSSLPLRSLPEQAVQGIAANWAGVLGAGARVVQFTYAPFTAPAWIRAGLERSASVTVWANFPPARVEVFHQP